MRNNIFKFLSLFILVCVFTTQYSVWTDTVQEVTVSSDQDEEHETVLKQISHETVIPHYNFAFGDFASFFENVSSPLLIAENIVSINYEIVPINFYLAERLEHHIAINAP